MDRKLQRLGSFLGNSNCIVLIGFAFVFFPMKLTAAPTQVTLIGEIEAISIVDKNDVWSRGAVSIGGVNVVIPRNLLIQLPARRHTLQELFLNAPSACKALGQTGLARADSCFWVNRGATATVRANRLDSGEVIAGEILITKATETLMGIVTYINYEHGYFRVNGQPNDAGSGIMVRINDKSARHTLQVGPGCEDPTVNTANCSPDIRFSVDPDNYQAAFVTGVPFCIPSTVIGGKRSKGANTSNGSGDPFCPLENRTKDPVVEPIPDATAHLFSPLVLGESLMALGNFEIVGGVKFFAASKLQLHARVMTKDGNPDYLSIDLAEWDAPGFSAQRARFRLIGYTSTADSQLDAYALYYDPQENKPFEFILASTAGNPFTVNRGIPPFGSSIFKVNYDVDFVKGPLPRTSPCFNLANAGFDATRGGCVSGFTVDLATNFRLLSPIAREVLVRTRNKTYNSPKSSIDISGNVAPNGLYVVPVDVAYPTPAEFNVTGLSQPFLFTGEPWLLDRRLGPNGCRSKCESAPQPLAPWPWDGGLDPRTQSAGGIGVPASEANRILTYLTKDAAGVYGFNGGQLSLPKAPSLAQPVVATVLAPARQCVEIKN